MTSDLPTAVEPTYPCDRCGKPRTKAQGGTIFTVCDDCWGALKMPTPTAPTLRAALAELSLASTIVLAQVDGKELLNSWQSKPDTKRLLAALELAREALSQ